MMMMHVNPYADEILEECEGEIEDLRKPILALLSIQHELSETRKAEAARAEKAIELTERAAATAERMVELTERGTATAERMVELTEMAYTPPRVVLGNQEPISPEDLKAWKERQRWDPISPEDLKAQMRSTKPMAVPDDSGDARIAEAAREFVKLYIAKKSSAVGAMEDLIQLVETIERTRR